MHSMHFAKDSQTHHSPEYIVVRLSIDRLFCLLITQDGNHGKFTPFHLEKFVVDSSISDGLSAVVMLVNTEEVPITSLSPHYFRQTFVFEYLVAKSFKQ